MLLLYTMSIQKNIYNLDFTDSPTSSINIYVNFMASKMKINCINIMSNLQVDDDDEPDSQNIYLLYCNLSTNPIAAIIGDGVNRSITYSENYIYFNKQSINTLIFNIVGQLLTDTVGENSSLNILLDVDIE